MIKYSFATLEDLPRIVDIYNQTIASREVTADLEPISVTDRTAWFHAHPSETRPLWVLKNSDDLIGWVSLSDFYGRPAYHKTAEISIYIEENYRGNGLGSQILTFIEQQLSAYEISTLVAFIFGHNHASLSLFERFGYKKWGHLPQVAELDDQKRDLLILGKKYRL